MRTRLLIGLAAALLAAMPLHASAQNYTGDELHELARVMSRYDVANSLLCGDAYQNELIAKTPTKQTVRRFTEWARQSGALKQSQDAQALTRPLPGAVTSFFVSYPFEGTSMFDFARPFSPENGYDTRKPPEGLQPPAMSWMPYQSVGNLSVVRPDERMKLNGAATIFLATRIIADSQKTVRAWIEIPSSSPVIAWMNGKRVLEFVENGPENAPLFGARYPVELRPGENILTLKTAQLENPPEFYVFLTDQKTGEPLAFETDVTSPITSGALDDSKPQHSLPSALEQIAKNEKMSPAVRAFAAQMYLPRNDDIIKINDFLMNDIDATAALPADELELAILLLDPSKSLQILKKAMPRFKGDARMALLYARQMILSAQNQGDAITRFIDEWPAGTIKILKDMKAPSVNGVSYEPLRQQLLALSELTVAQPLTAHARISEVLRENPEFYQILNTFPLGTLSDSKKLYQQSVDDLLKHDLNSSTLIVEKFDLELQKYPLHSGNYAALSATLSAIQKEAVRFFKIHPYDEIFWDFWLDVLSNYGIDTAMVRSNPELLKALGDAEFTADAESWFVLYITMRSNDPQRWLRYARHCLHAGRTSDAVEAYEMAAMLQPKDETIAERVNAIRRMHSIGDPQQASASVTDAFETPYVIKDIPGNSDPNASELVSLLDNRVVRVLANGLTSTYYQLAFEIIDEKGLKSLRAMPLQYSPDDEKIDIISVTTTKKDGSVRRLYKTNEYDLADESIKMYYNQKALLIEIQDLAVGDRVEYQFKRTQTQRESSSILFFSDIFQLQSAISRQWMRYTVIAPESVKMHMLRHAPSSEPKAVGDVKIENGNAVTTYEEKNSPRHLAEKMQPGPTALMPCLLISTFASWQELANWYIDLSAQQWKADDAIRAKVKELTDGVADPLEKLKRIHAFVVKSTRYVALEFGIHGHKPYPAAQVFERRFGDCKDKASLLKVMLKEAGIDSEFVIARTRMNGDVTTQLPTPYLFDHAILYVPQFDLFLDGTAEFSGIYELPAMDQDGIAFIVRDDASYTLRKIPVAPADDNVSTYTWRFDFTGPDSVPYEHTAELHGFNAPNYREKYQSESLQRENLEQEVAFSIPGSKLDSFEFSDLSDLNKDVTLNLRASTALADIVKVSNNEWLIYPQIVESNMVAALTSGAKRRSPIIRPVKSTLKKSITLVLPPGAQIALPDDVSEKTSFGTYTIAARKQNDEVTTTSEIIIDRIEINPEEYPDYIDFLQRFDRRLNTQYHIRVRQ